MPSIKLKTHKGVKSRFKVTATGKVVHKPCGTSHINSHKPGSKIRKLRKQRVLKVEAVAARYRRALLVDRRRDGSRDDAPQGPQAPWRKKYEAPAEAEPAPADA